MMITYDHIMVRFGELSTKGKNKIDFIRVLYKNILRALKDFNGLETYMRHDHIYVVLHDVDYKPVVERLQEVSGIQGLSLVHKAKDRDIENIKNVSLELIKQETGKTFKVKVKRTDKKYPMVSDEITRAVAGHILRNTEFRVDVHNPDILLSIEVKDEAVYVFSHTYPGAGGYPLGVAGKAMHMLSGGIDSPVAAYLMMRRGVTIECIHFASPPYTQMGDSLSPFCRKSHINCLVSSLLSGNSV